MAKPIPNPRRSPAGANCGVHMACSVSGFTTGPPGPRPDAKSTLMNRPRSVTVEYMLPAGAMPSWNFGASNIRPS